MKYVYILESLDSRHFYVGITDDLRARLRKHNGGEVPHTSKFGPWKIRTYVAFSREKQAISFERFLKSGSGRAFAKKHLWCGGLDALRRKQLTRGLTAPNPYSPNAALSRSRRATISFFIADSSPIEHAEAARMDWGTARAFSRSA